MPRSNQAIWKVIKDEGIKHTNDPDDPGGNTVIGITKRKFPEAYDNVYKALLRDKNIAKELAYEFYENEFWNPLFNSLHAGLAEKIFSLSVNMGKETLIQYLQEALNTNWGDSLSVDGSFGYKTLQAVESHYWESVRSALILRCQSHYNSIIKKKPKLQKYYLGWMNRLFS